MNQPSVPTVRQLVASMESLSLDELHALRSNMMIGKSKAEAREYAAICVLIKFKTPARRAGGK